MHPRLPALPGSSEMIGSFVFLELVPSKLTAGFWRPPLASLIGPLSQDDKIKLVVFGIIAVLVLLAWYTTKKKQERLLVHLSELLDERSGQPHTSFASETGELSGHFQGRGVRFSLQEGSRTSPSKFNITLSCEIPFMFAVKRKRIFLGISNPPSGKLIETGDPELDRKFFFSDVIGGTGGRFTRMVMRLPAVPQEEHMEERQRFSAWIRDPEVKKTMDSLFYARRVDYLTPTSVLGPGEGPQGRGTGLSASHYRYRRKELEVNNVRMVMEDLNVLARSLDSKASRGPG